MKKLASWRRECNSKANAWTIIENKLQNSKLPQLKLSQHFHSQLRISQFFFLFIFREPRRAHLKHKILKLQFNCKNKLEEISCSSRTLETRERLHRTLRRETERAGKKIRTKRRREGEERWNWGIRDEPVKILNETGQLENGKIWKSSRLLFPLLLFFTRTIMLLFDPYDLTLDSALTIVDLDAKS